MGSTAFIFEISLRYSHQILMGTSFKSQHQLPNSSAAQLNYDLISHSFGHGLCGSEDLSP